MEKCFCLWIDLWPNLRLGPLMPQKMRWWTWKCKVCHTLERTKVQIRWKFVLHVIWSRQSVDKLRMLKIRLWLQSLIQNCRHASGWNAPIRNIELRIINVNRACKIHPLVIFVVFQICQRLFSYSDRTNMLGKVHNTRSLTFKYPLFQCLLRSRILVWYWWGSDRFALLFL